MEELWTTNPPTSGSIPDHAVWLKTMRNERLEAVDWELMIFAFWKINAISIAVQRADTVFLTIEELFGRIWGAGP